MIDYSIVLDKFDCDPDSGVLYWAMSPSKKVSKGAVAGSLNDCGYVVVRVNGVNYRAHRIIFMKCAGPIPQGMDIDHIDRNKSNNKLSNLRCVTKQQNQFNKAASKASKFGFKGVSKNGQNGFRATASLNGKQIYLGTFKSPELAGEAYLNFSFGKHGDHSCFV